MILFLPGMSPDVRLFDRLLPLVPDAVVVPWIEPKNGETIRRYAQRLAQSLPNVAEFARIQAAGARSLATSATVVCGVIQCGAAQVTSPAAS